MVGSRRGSVTKIAARWTNSARSTSGFKRRTVNDKPLQFDDNCNGLLLNVIGRSCVVPG